MGGGTYSSTRRLSRAVEKGYADRDDALTAGLVDKSYRTRNVDQVFKQNRIHKTMDPNGLDVRESRDSEEHPESIAIIVALDVTGSMGNVPYSLIKKGLPNMMETILGKGVKDPQVLFAAIGDHECDQAPLQVGQFESSDELMDRWLQNVYLEGCGGGNNGESYHLAWLLAGYHTSIDCFEKRGKKGFLFTIGDEPVLSNLPEHDIKNIMGPGQYSKLYATELLEKAREKYHVFHIHILETGAGASRRTQDGWEELMGKNLLKVQRHNEVAATIANAIVNTYKENEDSKNETKEESTEEPKEKTKITL